MRLGGEVARKSCRGANSQLRQNLRQPWQSATNLAGSCPSFIAPVALYRDRLFVCGAGYCQGYVRVERGLKGELVTEKLPADLSHVQRSISDEG